MSVATLLVLDDPAHLGSAGTDTVSARDYIQGAGAELPSGTRVRTIATDHSYLSLAYHVALVAEARGHVPFPDARALLTRGIQARPPVKRSRLDTMGVLSTPNEPFAASSAESLQDFAGAATALGLSVQFFSRSTILDGLDRIGALFVRDLTHPGNAAFQAALLAERSGMPVVDDCASIIRCSSKVFVQSLLARHGVSTPRTLLVTPEMTMTQIAATLGLPVVVKIPDGSFSRGVHRAQSICEGERILAEMRTKSAVVIAQEFVPTDFDWRIGVLNGAPIFACRYFMARGHWQIRKEIVAEERSEGETEAVALADVPLCVTEAAARAARLVGTGLYGVDVKHQGGRTCVIEVNDNPDIDSDCEARLPGSAVWSKIAEWFATKMVAAEGSNCCAPTTGLDPLALTA
jgi:glutathione synthase/RimK-type ligase-like ATP-grasp enzyme